MEKTSTRYPSYDVMDEQHAWDEHTRSIVLQRLHTTGGYRFLTDLEAEALRAWCSLLVDDRRPEAIRYVLDHIDQSLFDGIESERRPRVPEARSLIRDGLRTLDAACQAVYARRFFDLAEERQRQLMSDIEGGEATPVSLWRQTNGPLFFRKLLALTVEGYYSHPAVWSEIGYGGPAYPRGYVRMETLDPWEAREEDRRHDA